MSITEEKREGFYLSEEGEWIPDGWAVRSLSELTSKIGSGATPRGGKDAYKSEGITLIRSQNILDLKFEPKGLAFIDEGQANQLSNVEIQEEDVLINITGDSVARVCKVPSSYLPARVNQHVAIIRADRVESDPRFLEYLLVARANKGDLLGLASAGATRNALTKGMLENFRRSVPCPAEQKAIAAVLGSLDDKIELLREQNETLEALAQTLFKRWFIDFNFPDENGNPYKDSDGKMEPSAFGEIPESWEVGSISLFANHIKNSVSPDKSPETLYLHYSIPSFDDGMEPVQERGLEIKSNKYEVVASSILVSKLNPGTPRIWQVQDVEENSICSTEFQVVKPQKDYFSFVYGALMSSPVRRELTGRAHGTSSSHQRVSPADIFEVPFPVSCDRRLEATFSETSHGLLIKAGENRAQIQTLTKLRDTLLPKLMKGELRVHH